MQFNANVKLKYGMQDVRVFLTLKSVNVIVINIMAQLWHLFCSHNNTWKIFNLHYTFCLFYTKEYSIIDGREKRASYVRFHII